MTQLKQGLELMHVFCIAAGAMICSGLFILPGLAHSQAGPAVVFSYFLAGLLASIGVLSVAELATAMPKAGGDYFFISRGMGAGVGTVAGLLSWFSLSTAAVLAFMTTANAGIMAASRYLLALSRDRQLPAGLGRLGRRTQIPYVSVLFTGLLVVLAVFVKLKILVEAASLVFMLSFMLSSASVIVLRESQLQGYRPKFKAPCIPGSRSAASPDCPLSSWKWEKRPF